MNHHHFDAAIKELRVVLIHLLHLRTGVNAAAGLNGHIRGIYITVWHCSSNSIRLGELTRTKKLINTAVK